MTTAADNGTVPAPKEHDGNPSTRARLTDAAVTTSLRTYRGPARLCGLHAQLVRCVGKLPMPARHSVRAMVIACRDARDPKDKAAHFGTMVGMTTVMHAGHAVMLKPQAEKAAAFGELFCRTPAC